MGAFKNWNILYCDININIKSWKWIIKEEILVWQWYGCVSRWQWVNPASQFCVNFDTSWCHFGRENFSGRRKCSLQTDPWPSPRCMFFWLMINVGRPSSHPWCCHPWAGGPPCSKSIGWANYGEQAREQHSSRSSTSASRSSTSASAFCSCWWTTSCEMKYRSTCSLQWGHPSGSVAMIQLCHSSMNVAAGNT